ncbi:ribonuclease H-like domain-containing protein [Tanacetum coccineum]
MNQFCERKGIKREFSVARTPQQNGAEAVNTACYVQNRVLVTKPHNKTPYELFLGRKLALGFMRPFGCPVTILNTIDYLGKFDGKADEGFFVGKWTKLAFDIDALTKLMNYKLVVAGNQFNGNACTKACDDAVQRVLLMLDSNLQEMMKRRLLKNQEKKAVIQVNVVDAKTSIELPLDLNMPELEDYSIFEDDKDVDAEIEEEDLFCQPPGFEDPDFPDRVYNVKRNFMDCIKLQILVLKGQPKLRLCYPKDSLFNLVAYTDSDYAGASLDRKSTTGVNAARHKLTAARHKLTAAGEKHDRGNINKTQSKATPNEPSSPGTSSGGGPRRQETMGDTIAQTRLCRMYLIFQNPLLERVIDLEKTKTTQAQEITSLKLRIVSSDEASLGDQEEDLIQTGINKELSDKDIKPSESITTTPTLTTTTAAITITATSTRPKAKGLVIHEEEQVPTLTVSSQQHHNGSKRAGDELEQESIKKQKVDEDKETTELKSLMEVIPDEDEVAVDAIPLATKPLSIIDWKIHKEGKKSFLPLSG